ncbi:hypothetical protein HPB47_003205 [Ixodes persulcatus]|uniref:Uncharacterized protein n=1 Tax=Ixodes persulcatus TaxID=34615 RepID=A0AC60PJ94_IXOPE|nr:hypothetical protein HPB47_003205 [Ixodes persulcatus]
MMLLLLPVVMPKFRQRDESLDYGNSSCVIIESSCGIVFLYNFVIYSLKTVKYPVGITREPDRTKERVESGMVEAFRTGVNVRGIKGLLPLINLPGFDIVWSFSPDYMYCVLLGVTLQFLELWLSNVGAAYYIDSPQLQKEFDERLCHIQPPQCMPRLPRSVKLRKYWKAVEWQQWLLYISLVCIDGILPDRSLTPFSLLVRGIFLLLQDEVRGHCVQGRGKFSLCLGTVSSPSFGTTHIKKS